MFRKKSKAAPLQSRTRPNPTGGQSASVFSYHASRSAASLPGGGRNAGGQPATRQKPSSRLRGGVRAIAVITVLAILSLNMLVSPTPELRTLRTGGGVERSMFLHSENEYRAAATDILSSSLLMRTKMTFDSRKAAQEMGKRFPELGTVTISLPFVGQQPVIRIEPATPALLLATTSGEAYVLDTAGKALAGLSQAPAVAKLRLPAVSDESGLTVRLGEIALPSTDIAFITEVVGQLKAKRIGIQGMILPPATSEFHLKVSGAPYTVKFNLRGNARAEAGAFLAVKQRLDKERVVPGSYIDVRVESRAYYK